jgi:hypothetical protein
VSEAHPVLEDAHAVVRDDELVLRAGGVRALAALAVGEARLAGVAAVLVDGRRDAQAEEHALHGLEGAQVRLGQADAHTLHLVPLHRTVGIEEAAEEPGVEVGRGRLERRAHGLPAASGGHPHAEGQVPEPGRAHAVLPAAGHGVPSGEVRAVREGAERRLGAFEDPGVGGAAFRVAVRNLALGPGGQDGAVCLEGAIADQEPQQVALFPGMVARPGGCGPVVVQDEAVPGLELTGRAPLLGHPVAGHVGGAEHLVVGGEAKRVPLGRPDPDQGLHPGREEALGARGVVVSAETCHEGGARELPHLPRALVGVHPGVGGDAGVRGLVAPELRHRVVLVRPVDEEHPGLAGLPRPVHDHVEDLAGVLGPHDLAGARTLELVLGARRHRIHEGIGNGEGDVEVRDLRRVILAGDELAHVRMIHPEDPHVRPPARTPLLHHLGRGVVELHERHRPRRHPHGGAHGVARGPEAREREPGPAPGLVHEGHGLERVVDAALPVRERVVHRQDEAGRELPQGAAGVHERRGVRLELALRHEVVEVPGHLLDGRVGRPVPPVFLGNDPRHAPEHGFRILHRFPVLVLLQVPLGQDDARVVR